MHPGRVADVVKILLFHQMGHAARAFLALGVREEPREKSGRFGAFHHVRDVTFADEEWRGANSRE